MSNLQLFTEPGGDGGGSGEGDGAGTGGDPGSNSNTTMSFDDFLKLEGNQSEFDRRVQKAVNTAVTMHDQMEGTDRMIRYQKQKSLLR